MATIGDRLRNRVLRWLFQGDGMSLTAEERKAQGIIVLARQYYDGEQIVYMTTRQKAWLDLHPGKVKFVVNISATVVDAVVERLKVTGFDVADDGEEDSGEDIEALLWTWWTANRMDAVQTEAHRSTVRDGEAFVITAWNAAEGRPDFILHQRFVDKTLGGDGFGCWMEYENDDPFGIAKRATKQWTELTSDGSRIRRTVYYPDRIEKYALDGDWKQVQDDGDTSWPLPWVTSQGQPLGIPVAHLRNPGLRSELHDIIPLQDALNKAWLDIMAASDSTAFRMLVVLGFVPTTDGKEPADDGSNLLQIAPGQMLSTRKKPGEVSIDAIEPASLDPLLQVEERIIFRVAQISDTPLNRFQISRQLAAEGTLKQGDAPLLAKVEERQTLIGNAWEDMMIQALRQAVAFGGLQYGDSTVNAVWSPAAVRDEKKEIEVATAKAALGVPTEQIWIELGYDSHQIAKMLKSPETQARLAGQQMAIALAQQSTTGQ